jgi:hypothetical protein
MMQNMAFDQTEAEAYINEIANERGIENVVLNFTFEKEMEGLRKVLKEDCFAEFL